MTRVLFVGMMAPGSRTLQRIRTLGEMGVTVQIVSTHPEGASYEDKPTLAERIRYRLRFPGDLGDANRTILKRLTEASYDILWLERAVSIRAATLRAAKRIAPDLRIVWYAEDDMMNPHHLSRWTERALPLFDVWVTTKSANAQAHEMPAKGVRRILFVDNSYDPALHRPFPISAEERRSLGSDVSFVGTFEAARAKSLADLARAGFDVRVWGNGWRRAVDRPSGLRIEDRPVYDDDYAKVVCASRLNLCFLRKENRDLQTCRSIEIPAMGGLMLHERNREIAGLFREGEEAVYFDSDAELIERCRSLLADQAECDRIARNGHRAVLDGGFRHEDRLRRILDAALRSGEAETMP
jgi:spore maturation protein CgeB